MKKSIKLLALLMVMCGLVYLSSCKKSHDDPSPLNLATVTANDIDLNGANPPSDVPTDAVITVVFSTDVDVSTATTSNITLTRDFDGANVDINVVPSGKTVTITPVNNLNSGALFVLAMGAGLKSTGGLSFTSTTRSFTTAGTFEPDGVLAHYSFENSTDDVSGSYDADAAKTHDVTYVDSHNALGGKAASFNGTTTIIEIPNADDWMSHGSMAISFWMKASTDKEGQFVMGLAGSKGFQFEILGGAWDATDKGFKNATQYQLPDGTDGEDTWWNGNPNGWQGSTAALDVTAAGGIISMLGDKWAHVVWMYNESTKVGTMYVNNQKAREWDFNLWPDDSPKKSASGVVYVGNATNNALAIGFIQASTDPTLTDDWADPTNPDNNHFKGQLDDIRIFSRALTSQEVGLMYNSEK